MKGPSLGRYIYVPGRTDINATCVGRPTDDACQLGCMEIRNAENNNDILEHYYCYNEEQQILYCYILVNGNKNFEIVGQF